MNLLRKLLRPLKLRTRLQGLQAIARQQRPSPSQHPVIVRWMEHLVPRLQPAEWKMLSQGHDDFCPLPAGAERDLAADSARLDELRQAYKTLSLPVCVHSQWHEKRVRTQVKLQYFRGENPYIWHYREWPRAVYLKYYIFAQYVRSRDAAGLIERLGEDGAFGCWSFDYPGIGRVSRDLLDSVNEIQFLDRETGLLGAHGLRVLDIGAGYGRLAHRISQAVPGLADYCCVDAIAESTFLSEYYLRHRGLARARALPLHELPQKLSDVQFDIALNVHSFSECTYDAIAWWMDWLKALAVPKLLIVPNDGEQLLSTEPDGSKRDFSPLLAAAGYHLHKSEPTIADAAVRELMAVKDYFLLFQRSP